MLSAPCTRALCDLQALLGGRSVGWVASFSCSLRVFFFYPYGEEKWVHEMCQAGTAQSIPARVGRCHRATSCALLLFAELSARGSGGSAWPKSCLFNPAYLCWRSSRRSCLAQNRFLRCSTMRCVARGGKKMEGASPATRLGAASLSPALGGGANYFPLSEVGGRRSSSRLRK